MSCVQPFRAERYALRTAAADAPAVDLAPFPAAAAPELGRIFAGIDPWASYPYPAEALSAYLADGEPRAPRFAIEADGQIAGVIGLRLDWLRGPYLQFLGILPAWQRQKLGGLVLDWLEREARPAQRNIWVCASDFNLAAIRFYERHGFARVAILDGLVQDDRAEVLMRKRLT